MRRLYTILILLAAILQQSIAQNAFYVYRNDGPANGFIREEVDSIICSHYDADSIYHTEYVTQLIYTPDSLYRIPLAVIDSIGFVNPATVYKPNIINMSDELMKYVTKCDSLTITFDESTPEHLFPKVGDKLVTLEMNNLFPAGFAGEVIDREYSKVVCTRIPLEEIFETYYHVASVNGYIVEEENGLRSLRTASAIRRVDKDFRLPTITIPYGIEFSRMITPIPDLEVKAGAEFSVELTPEFHIHTTLIINKEEGTYLNASVTGTLGVKEILTGYGGIEWNHDFLDNVKYEEPIAPLITFVFNPGIFLRANAILSWSTVFEQNYKFGWGRDWSSKGRNVLKPYCGGHLVSWNADVTGGIDGSIAVGGFAEVGIAIAESRLDKLVFRGELGGEFVAHAVLYNSDIATTNSALKAYERLKSSNFEVNVFANTSLQLKFLKNWGVSVPLPWKLKYNLKTWDVVPTFSNTYFRQRNYPRRLADASVEMTGDCLFPITVGYSLRNSQDVEFDGCYSEEKFDNGNKYFSYTFSGISGNEQYTVFPKVRIFDKDIIALPAAEMEKAQLPVSISSVTTTAAQYRPTDHPQHFIYKDSPYEFKYDVATVVKLADDEGVENWGYVYEGPYEGDKKSRISLKGATPEYKDTRFPYYRNGNPTTHTARLYPFMKYTGDDEYYYGEPVDYSLTYPETSTVELTGCSTNDVVTRENVEYNGVTYDYCSTFILDYNATGAYWITVGAEETGNGWSGWDNNLPARERVRAADGSNRLTINYYYNQKVLEGDYLLRIKGSDEQHNPCCTSNKSVRLTHNGKTFTGCELIQ